MLITKVLIYVAVLIVSPVALASASDERYPVDAIASIDRVSGVFHQERHIAGLPKPLRSSGEFIYWRNKGVFYKTLDPFVEDVAFTDKGIVGSEKAYSGIGKKAGRYFGRLVMAIFSGSKKDLNKFFEENWVYVSGGWEGSLYPKDKRIKKGLLRINIGGNDFVESISFFSTNHEKTVINFSQHQIFTELSSEQCSWVINYIDGCTKQQSLLGETCLCP